MVFYAASKGKESMHGYEKQAALAAVENKKELLQQVADSIWAYAELSLQEYRSAALYEQVLEEEGFTVERAFAV